MPNSPSFRARPRAPAFPPSSTTLSHLLLPSLSLLLFLPYLLSLSPAAPPFLPPPLTASPSGDGSPAHILPSSHGASPRLAGLGPEACTAPQPSVATLAWDTNASSSGSSRGSPGDHVQEVLESVHQLVSVPSKNTRGVWASLSLE